MDDGMWYHFPYATPPPPGPPYFRVLIRPVNWELMSFPAPQRVFISFSIENKGILTTLQPDCSSKRPQHLTSADHLSRIIFVAVGPVVFGLDSEGLLLLLSADKPYYPGIENIELTSIKLKRIQSHRDSDNNAQSQSSATYPYIPVNIHRVPFSLLCGFPKWVASLRHVDWIS